MMRSIFSLLVVVFVCCGVAHSDAFKSEEQLQPFVDKVMSAVAKQDFDIAFDLMKPVAVVPEAEMAALSVNNRVARNVAGVRFGKTIGYECIETKKIGQSLIKIVCLEKAEKHALPWTFVFYNGPDGWVLNHFNWNDKPAALFD